MRISHIELESCRTNPRDWVAAKLFSHGGRFSYGYNQALKSAICTYHTSNDAKEAKKYLNEKLKRLANEHRKSQYENTLQHYIKWAENSKVIVADCKVRLNLTLDIDVILGGEISRIDIDPIKDNYRAVILGDAPSNWSKELRVPLIQYEIGRQYLRPIEKVYVAIQHLDGSGLKTAHYRKSEVDGALDEAKKMGKVIHGELLKHTASSSKNP